MGMAALPETLKLSVDVASSLEMPSRYLALFETASIRPVRCDVLSGLSTERILLVTVRSFFAQETFVQKSQRRMRRVEQALPPSLHRDSKNVLPSVI